MADITSTIENEPTLNLNLQGITITEADELTMWFGKKDEVPATLNDIYSALNDFMADDDLEE